jgi:hypothetical protein
MMAFEMFEGMRESYREEWREANREKKQKPENDFERMKRRAGL